MHSSIRKNIQTVPSPQKGTCSPLKMGHTKKGKDHLPTIHFQGICSFHGAVALCPNLAGASPAAWTIASATWELKILSPFRFSPPGFSRSKNSRTQGWGTGFWLEFWVNLVFTRSPAQTSRSYEQVWPNPRDDFLKPAKHPRWTWPSRYPGLHRATRRHL